MRTYKDIISEFSWVTVPLDEIDGVDIISTQTVNMNSYRIKPQSMYAL